MDMDIIPDTDKDFAMDTERDKGTKREKDTERDMDTNREMDSDNDLSKAFTCSLSFPSAAFSNWLATSFN